MDIKYHWEMLSVFANGCIYGHNQGLTMIVQGSFRIFLISPELNDRYS